MRFFKYHGLGNDFIIINNMDHSIQLDSGTIEEMCRRGFGIGADGVILVEPSNVADIKMIIYNSDGSRPEMCGNGIRCFAKYVYDKHVVRADNIAVETDAGIMNIEIHTDGVNMKTAVVNMGKPDFASSSIPVSIEKEQLINHEVEVLGTKVKITSMLMGVPHTVVFVETLEEQLIRDMGKALESHRLFPSKTNVNFVKVVDRDNMAIRTWERGAGYTYACGTGACASVAAAFVNDLINPKVNVQLRGGQLIIHWREREDILMEGPAEEIFEGKYLKTENKW